jgi:aspartyl-tRNA(Asn)/glutamyl-tRNA(Gln) amidotransferase subunit A
MALHELTIAEARAQLDSGATTAVALTEAALARIAALEPSLHAFLLTTPEIALSQAQAADQRIAAGQAGPLTGIPLGIKDVIVTKDIRTTCGSKILENWVPPYDATVVTKLKEAGAVTLGKLNMDEFAMGSSNENSAFGGTRNPWDLERVPGGSSGGSAAAVAAGEAFGTLGTDTGGSIRQPAALCGVVGIKPTYGRVSRFGLVAFASSLDQCGPFARTVEDAALLLETIAGYDPRDSTSANLAVPDYRAALTGDVRGLRVGVPREYFVDGMEPGVEAAVRTAKAPLKDLGAQIFEVSLPHTKYALPVYYIIAPAECSTNLARFDGVRYGVRLEGKGLFDEIESTRGELFGAEVRRRIMLGTYALSSGYYDAYYRRAQQVRTLIRRDFQQVWGQVDLLAAPTSPTVAFKIGAKADDPLAMYLSDVCTLPINLAGVPGLVVPCGFSEGLPTGLQLIGQPFDETTLLRAGHAYERANTWHTQRPPL